MKNCINCGQQLADQVSFCPTCGANQNVAQQPQQPVYQQQYQASTAPVGQLKTNRGLVKYVLLSLITFGIYGIVVMCKVPSDLNVIASRYDGKQTKSYLLMVLLLSWLTLGIYPLIWYHGMSARIGNELKRRGINYNFSAASFWLWNTLGCLIIVGPIVYTGKLFKAMNLLSEHYNVNG